MKNPRLVQLYQEMSDHTKGKCGATCGMLPDLRPHRCCERTFCAAAREYARTEYGIDLVPTGHPTIPYMGPNGCTVAPHLRPICTLHTCEINSVGCTKDPQWDEKYFELFDDINLTEFGN
jgi:hypothetical protein